VIALLTLAPTLAATAAKKTSANPFSLIFIVVIVGAVYFLFLRPQQQRARRQREHTSSINVGDEVLTAGGIIGKVVEAHDDRLVIESGGADSLASFGATPSRMVVVRSAITRKIEPPVADDDDDDDVEDEDDHDENEHDGGTDGSSDSQPGEGSGT